MFGSTALSKRQPAPWRAPAAEVVVPCGTLLALGLLAGCSIAPTLPNAVRAYDLERFAPDTTHVRTYDANVPTACAAARRALLGQGFGVFVNEPGHVHARKFYKPAPGTGVELAVDITCIGRGDASAPTSVYVVAWQDEYVTQRAVVTGSVGLPVLGNVSAPVASTEAALVKVGVETVADAGFFARFFALLDRVVRE